MRADLARLETKRWSSAVGPQEQKQDLSISVAISAVTEKRSSRIAVTQDEQERATAGPSRATAQCGLCDAGMFRRGTMQQTTPLRIRKQEGPSPELTSTLTCAG